MGRPLNWNNLAVIINTIRKKPTEWKDLLALKIPEKTLHRYLTEYLGEKGVNLVRKEGEKWVWCGYEYPREKTPQELALEIDHAKKLMPGLSPLLEEDQTFLLECRENPHVDFVDEVHRAIEHKATSKMWKNFRLSEYFEEHLKSGYPEIYEDLCFYRENFPHLGTILMKRANLMEKAKEYAKEWQKKHGGPREEFLFRNKQEGEKYRDCLIFQKGLKSLYNKLFDSLQDIRISIEVGGNPLRGHCRACPNIIIKEEK
jgi:hypothetical protein